MSPLGAELLDISFLPILAVQLGLLLGVGDVVPTGDLLDAGHHHPDAPLFLLPLLLILSAFCNTLPSSNLSVFAQPLDKIDSLSNLSQPSRRDGRSFLARDVGRDRS